jgi:[acyl-carrier-protein] S-malonyltransferase
VRWVECVQAIKARGVTHVVECGPGKVLAGMTKRIDAELVGASLYDPATLAEVKSFWLKETMTWQTRPWPARWPW